MVGFEAKGEGELYYVARKGSMLALKFLTKGTINAVWRRGFPQHLNPQAESVAYGVKGRCTSRAQ